jgi:hypothetical protein
LNLFRFLPAQKNNFTIFNNQEVNQNLKVE